MNLFKEKKMKNLLAFLALVFAFTTNSALASVRVFNSSGTQLGTFTDLQLGNGLAVSQVSGKAKVSQATGDGTASVAGFLHAQTDVTGSLTAAQCGYTVTGDATGGSTPTFTLPTITPALLGCRYTFVHGGKRTLVVPQSTNQILVLTSAVNHSVSTDTTGGSVTLEAIAPGWFPVGKEAGTWTAN